MKIGPRLKQQPYNYMQCPLGGGTRRRLTVATGNKCTDTFDNRAHGFEVLDFFIGIVWNFNTEGIEIPYNANEEVEDFETV